MRAEIINIGDELLIGQVVNTNASWMAEQLNLNGIEVVQITVVSDTVESIKASLDSACKNADLVILTGGLGPTKDDITKQVLCDYFNTNLIFNEEAHQQLKEFFALRNLKLSERNRHQAMLPENCIPLKNIHGTAPGMWFEHQKTIIVSLPGVPFEMKSLLKDHILARIKQNFETKHIIKRTLLTQGIGESDLADRISDWESNLPDNFKLAYLPQPGITRLRLSATVDKPDGLESEMKSQLTKLHQIIPELIWGYEDDTMEKVVGELLHKKGKSVSTAESCSGGNIAQLITSISGSSDYFQGSVVAYSNEVKMNVLKVKAETLDNYGAVSEEVVKEMALGAQKLFDTNYAISTSGIAGPSGGSIEKPVGTTWIAIACPNKSVITKKFTFGEHRGRNIRKTSISALNMLRKALLESN